MKVKNNMVILFQGDSITDCARDYSKLYSLAAAFE